MKLHIQGMGQDSGIEIHPNELARMVNITVPVRREEDRVALAGIAQHIATTMREVNGVNLGQHYAAGNMRMWPERLSDPFTILSTSLHLRVPEGCTARDVAQEYMFSADRGVEAALQSEEFGAEVRGYLDRYPPRSVAAALPGTEEIRAVMDTRASQGGTRVTVKVSPKSDGPHRNTSFTAPPSSDDSDVQVMVLPRGSEMPLRPPVGLNASFAGSEGTFARTVRMPPSSSRTSVGVVTTDVPPDFRTEGTVGENKPAEEWTAEKPTLDDRIAVIQVLDEPGVTVTRTPKGCLRIGPVSAENVPVLEKYLTAKLAQSVPGNQPRPQFELGNDNYLTNRNPAYTAILAHELTESGCTVTRGADIDDSSWQRGSSKP